MLKEGQVVRMIGGPWQGHRGLITAMPEPNDGGPVLVAVERFGEGGGWGDTPIPSYPSHWISQGDIVPLKEPGSVEPGS